MITKEIIMFIGYASLLCIAFIRMMIQEEQESASKKVSVKNRSEYLNVVYDKRKGIGLIHSGIDPGS